MDSGLPLTRTRHKDETLQLHCNLQQHLHSIAICNGFLLTADSAILRPSDAEKEPTTQRQQTMIRVPAGRIRRVLPTTTTCIPTYLHSSRGIGFSLPAIDTLLKKKNYFRPTNAFASVTGKRSLSLFRNPYGHCTVTTNHNPTARQSDPYL